MSAARPPHATEQSPWTLVRNWWRDWSRPAWDFVFPPACLLCGGDVAETAAICAACRTDLARPAGLQCQRCAAPVGPHLETHDGCIHCRHERFAFRRVLAWGVYDGRLRQAILRAKGPHGRAMATALADLFLDDLLADVLTEPFDAIVPVPHDWRRRVWQLHAPSETFAARLAKRLDRRLSPHLIAKPRPTPRQAAASPSERRQQQHGAFATPAALDLGGARLLLVDDVLTTGGTAHAASKSLKDAGAADVVVAVLARGLGRHSAR